jgi:diguanylate cyclase (GGDEF)-like protein
MATSIHAASSDDRSHDALAHLPQLGFGHAGPNVRLAATSLALVLLLSTLGVVRFGGTTAHESHEFMPIVATLWCAADLLTAFLLTSQFFVTGRLALAGVGIAYLLTGLLTIPFIATFPGIFITAPSPSQFQIAAWLWLTWHALFPIAIAVVFAFDPSMRVRIHDPYKLRNAVVFALGGASLLAVAVACFLVFDNGALPTLMKDGKFTPFYLMVGYPVDAFLNAAACLFVLYRARPGTPLQIWLAVALFTGMLDCLLNDFSPGRYTATWYAGKIQTLFTSSVVLGMLLIEVLVLYRQLASLASVDPLTGLRNRRDLETSLEWAVRLSRQRESGFAVLVIDVDNFKAFNDTYGHSGGDVALRSVAQVLRSGITVRSRDIVARYGGEEFVIVLPCSTADDARTVAERVREHVAGLAIEHTGSAVGHLTVSVGIGFVAETIAGSAETAFELADAAVYDAKRDGRNRVVFRAAATSKVRTLRSA